MKKKLHVNVYYHELLAHDVQIEIDSDENDSYADVIHKIQEKIDKLTYDPDEFKKQMEPLKSHFDWECHEEAIYL